MLLQLPIPFQQYIFTIESHLSKLQLFEHVSYPNMFSKPLWLLAPMGVSFRCSNGVFQDSLHTFGGENMEYFYRQGKLCNEGRSNCQHELLGILHVNSGN